MDDLSFLDDRTPSKTGNAVLSVTYTDGSFAYIDELSLEVIEVTCPLLALAFETTRSGPRHYIENFSRDAIASLLRFIHVFPRHYIPEQLKPTIISMLLHVEVYRLATIYDMPELKMQAGSNITQDCELACSTARQPLDVCKAIRYIYEHLPKEQELIETITNYCVTCFLFNKLDESEDFRSLAYELRQFQQDICMINYKRGFVDEAAMGIIQLPIKPCRDPYKAMTERRVLGDFLYDLWDVKKMANGGLIDIVRDDVVTASGEHRSTFAQAPAARFPLPYRPRPISTADRLDIIESMTKSGLAQMSSRAPRPSITVSPPQILQREAADEEVSNGMAAANPAPEARIPSGLASPQSIDMDILVDSLTEEAAASPHATEASNTASPPVPDQEASLICVDEIQSDEHARPSGPLSDIAQGFNGPRFSTDRRGPLIDYSSSGDHTMAHLKDSNSRSTDPSWLGTELPRVPGEIPKSMLHDRADRGYAQRAINVLAEANAMLESNKLASQPEPDNAFGLESRSQQTFSRPPPLPRPNTLYHYDGPLPVLTPLDMPPLAGGLPGPSSEHRRQWAFTRSRVMPTPDRNTNRPKIPVRLGTKARRNTEESDMRPQDERNERKSKDMPLRLDTEESWSTGASVLWRSQHNAPFERLPFTTEVLQAEREGKAQAGEKEREAAITEAEERKRMIRRRVTAAKRSRFEYLRTLELRKEDEEEDSDEEHTITNSRYLVMNNPRVNTKVLSPTASPPIPAPAQSAAPRWSAAAALRWQAQRQKEKAEAEEELKAEREAWRNTTTGVNCASHVLEEVESELTKGFKALRFCELGSAVSGEGEGALDQEHATKDSEFDHQPLVDASGNTQNSSSATEGASARPLSDLYEPYTTDYKKIVPHDTSAPQNRPIRRSCVKDTSATAEALRTPWHDLYPSFGNLEPIEPNQRSYDYPMNEDGPVAPLTPEHSVQPATSPPASVISDGEAEYDMVTPPLSSPAIQPKMFSHKPKGNIDRVPHLGADYDPVVPPSWMMGNKKVVLPACENGAAESVSSLTASAKTLHINEPEKQDDLLQVDADSDAEWDLI